MRKFVIVLSAVLLLCVAAFFFLPAAVESRLNPVLSSAPYRSSERAGALHRKLLVADLHADSLLWGRDLSARTGRGHVDVPRLIEGGVALQAFTIVTKVPRGLNIERNDDGSDIITPLVIAQGLPVKTWRSLKERALHQAQRLEAVAAQSDGKFVVIKTTYDLTNYLERRSRNSNITAGLLGIEGAHALEGDLSNIDSFFDHGIRIMSPTHFFDNDIGGSAHGVAKGGLTDKGREMVRRMQAKGMIVDLAHASDAVIADTLAITTKPVVVSHTGVRGTCDNKRNLGDEQIKGVAATGGVVGIGYWETAVCGTDAAAIARSIRYTADLIGVEHVGLGSDFDGAVAVPFDTTGVVQITDALLAEGFDENQIKMIMGGNVLRVLMRCLP